MSEEMGKILSNEGSVERIVNQNKSVANKIIQWIRDVLAKLTKRGSQGEYYNYLRKTEKLFAEAVKHSIGGVTLSDVKAFAEFDRIVSESEKAEENVANKEKSNYNE